MSMFLVLGSMTTTTRAPPRPCKRFLVDFSEAVVRRNDLEHSIGRDFDKPVRAHDALCANERDVRREHRVRISTDSKTRFGGVDLAEASSFYERAEMNQDLSCHVSMASTRW